MESGQSTDDWFGLYLEIVEGKCSNSIQFLGIGTERRVHRQGWRDNVTPHHWPGEGRPVDLVARLRLRWSCDQSQWLLHFRDVFAGKATGLDVEGLEQAARFGSRGRGGLWRNGVQPGQ